VVVMCVVTARPCNVKVQSWSGGGPKNIPKCKTQRGYVKLNGIKMLDKPSCAGGFSGDAIVSGLYLVRIDALLCDSKKTVHFNIQNKNGLKDYLNKLPNHAVIAGVSIEDAMAKRLVLDALDAELGVHITDVKYRGSFAFVAQKTTKKNVVDKVMTAASSQNNPAHLNVNIFGMSAKIGAGKWLLKS